jgi:hypothetical protein
LFTFQEHAGLLGHLLAELLVGCDYLWNSIVLWELACYIHTGNACE